MSWALDRHAYYSSDESDDDDDWFVGSYEPGLDEPPFASTVRVARDRAGSWSSRRDGSPPRDDAPADGRVVRVVLGPARAVTDSESDGDSSLGSLGALRLDGGGDDAAAAWAPNRVELVEFADLQMRWLSLNAPKLMAATVETTRDVVMYAVRVGLANDFRDARRTVFAALLVAAKFHECETGRALMGLVVELAGGRFDAREIRATEMRLLAALGWDVRAASVAGRPNREDAWCCVSPGSTPSSRSFDAYE